MGERRSWPDYCRRETLAKRLDVAAGAIDQMVRRGLLPPPVMIDGAPRWRWQDVDAMMAEGKVADAPDPYIAGIHNAAQAPAARPLRQKQAR